MVRLFAHRANLSGPATGENHPEAIQECLRRGFGVEIDLWNVDGACWVGHHGPEHRVDADLLKDDQVICHAKHIAVIPLLLQLGVTVFGLEEDQFALCSNGLIWTNYGCPSTPRSIVCSPELMGAIETRAQYYARMKACCYGICTDYPQEYRALMSDST